jgi:zinc protease
VLDRARTQMLALARSAQAQPSSALGSAMPDHLYGGDKRFHGTPDFAAIRGLTIDTLRAYWTRELGEGPITVEAVGDFDRDALVAAVAKSLGTLPPRPDRPLTPADVATMPSKPGHPIVILHSGAPDQAIYAGFWPTVGRYADVQEARALRLAAEVVKTRLTEQFRGQSGGTYAPFAASEQSDMLPAFGMFVVGAQVQKDRIEEFRTKLLAVVADLTTTEISADELDRARTPVLSLLARGQASSNDFWMGTIDSWVDDPRYIKTFETLESGYRAVTPADIRRAVVKYLKPGGAIEARVVGESPSVVTASPPVTAAPKAPAGSK